VWCEDAIAAAVARRRILEWLVPLWLGRGVRLPRTGGFGWNAERRAHEITSEFIPGRHVPLRADAPADGDSDPVRELVRDVQRPLQRHLREAGLDGLLWQAGLGNPVAANNFMLLERDGGGAGGDGAASREWVWIDLESGVPALFPMNPWRLVSFYLPKTLRHRRPLFDDVDVAKLRAYLESRRAVWDGRLGGEVWEALRADVDELERRQHAWRRLRRAHRSIAYALSQGRITAEQADHYRRHVVRWYVRLLAHGVVGAARGLAHVIARAARWVARIRWRAVGRTVRQFCTSQRFRTRVAHRYVFRRVGLWEIRRIFTPAEAQAMRQRVRRDESSEYLTDFGVHIALKPVVKTTQYTALPILLATGHYLAAAVMMASVGVVARTLYTTGRLIQQAVRGQPLPWVAWFVGLLPAIGNLAYPMQLLYRAGRHDRLAQFIVRDALAQLGRAVPIWGGKDSLTEHVCNRLPDAPGRWWAKVRRRRDGERGDVATPPTSP
jgi:hypothetical protein